MVRRAGLGFQADSASRRDRAARAAASDAPTHVTPKRCDRALDVQIEPRPRLGRGASNLSENSSPVALHCEGHGTHRLQPSPSGLLTASQRLEKLDHPAQHLMREPGLMRWSAYAETRCSKGAHCAGSRTCLVPRTRTAKGLKTPVASGLARWRKGVSVVAASLA